MRRWPFVFFRYLVTSIAFAQRFPLYLILAVGLPVCLLLYFVLRIHRLPVYFLKTWLWLFFGLNGIRIHREKDVFDREPGRFFCVITFRFWIMRSCFM